MRNTIILYIVLVCSQLIASFTHVIAKNITASIPPEQIVFFRAALSTLFYIVWALFNKKNMKKIDRKDIYKLFILGALNIPINQFLFLTSIHYTTAPNVAFAYGLVPVFVLVIAVIFLKEKLSLKKSAGIVLALSGIIVLFVHKGPDFSQDTFLGNMLILIASISWSLYTIIGKNFIKKYGAFYSTFLSMMTGFILYLPIYFSIADDYSIASITSVQWLQLLYMGLITSGLGYGIWYWCLQRMEASKLAVFNNMQPVFTTILSVIFLGQILSGEFIIGGILIIIGVIVTQKG